MAYADLTAEEKQGLQDWVNLLRPTAGELARFNNHAEAVNTVYNGPQLTPILAQLADGDEIPNTSGLAGSGAMTKAQVVTIVSYLQTALTLNTSAHRANLALAAGGGNLIG